MDATLRRFDSALPALDVVKGIVDVRVIAGVNAALLHDWQATASP